MTLLALCAHYGVLFNPQVTLYNPLVRHSYEQLFRNKYVNFELKRRRQGKSSLRQTQLSTSVCIILRKVNLRQPIKRWI